MKLNMIQAIEVMLQGKKCRRDRVPVTYSIKNYELMYTYDNHILPITSPDRFDNKHEWEIVDET